MKYHESQVILWWFYGDFLLWSQGTPLKSLGSARFPKARKPFGGASHTALQPAADVGHCGATSEPKKIGWFHGDFMVIWWFSGDLKAYFIGFVMVVNGIFHGDLNQAVVLHGTSWWTSEGPGISWDFMEIEWTIWEFN